MKVVQEPTTVIKVYVAGMLTEAERSLRQQCFDTGMCVTLTPTRFVYTGGAEDGVEVGFVNYPRFPTDEAKLLGLAQQVGRRLMQDLNQMSYLVVSPTGTYWYTRRPEDNK